MKLTQLGLDLDRGILLRESREADRAHSPRAKKRLWIDMEQSPYVDVTLELYRRARSQYPNVGVCVQAYLYRTEKDLESLIAMGAAVRLVKGAYNEPSEIAYPKKSDVDENYFRLAQMLLSPEARRRGVRAALATHDVKLIARISEWAAAQGIAKDQIEFAMLYGIQRGEQLRLAREGYRCSVLVSYGSFWFPWFVRRLAERPANLLFLARNLFSGSARRPNLARALVLFDFAVAQANHAMGVQRDVRLVRHQDDGVAALVQPREKRHDFIAGRGVEISGGFVGQQDRRMVHQRASDGHALALSAGKLVGLVHHAVRRDPLARALSWRARGALRRACRCKSAAAPHCAEPWRAAAG